MRVYFSAAHSCGKTTCARYVSEHHKLPLLSETARMVLSERELQVDSLRHDMKLVDSYQTEVFERQLSEEKKLKDFVADRSAVDCLAYSGNHTRILPKLLKDPKLEPYLASLRAPESIIFYVKPSHATLKSDGVREALDWNGIIAIDAQIKLLYEMFEIRVFQIDTDSMQERAKLIDSVLELAKPR